MLIYARGLYHSLEGHTWSFNKRYISRSDGIIMNTKGHILKIRQKQNTLSLIDDDDIVRIIRVNRFILSSFIDEKPPIGYHADHIDEERPTDNSLNNLQWLSIPDNNKKKRKPIRERRSCVPIIRIGTDGKVYEFPSVLKAADETGIDQSSINRSCFKNLNGLCHFTRCGSFWKYDVSKLVQKSLDNEKWVNPLMKNGLSYSKNTNIKVSSMGRIMWVQPIVRIFDSVSLNTERSNALQTRASITIFYETRQLHELICTTFHGPSPFEGAIVRHLNDNYLDCRIDNLKWGTRKDNGNDAIINNKMKTTIITIDKIEFKTMTSAAKYLNISTGYLSEICSRENKTTFSSSFFTVNTYVWKGKTFFKRADLARENKISIGQARALQRTGDIQICAIKTIDLKQ